MKVRMLFGTVVSGGLAFGALRLPGFLGNGAGLFETSVGVLLAGLYLAIFWSGVTGWSSGKASPEPFQVTWSESEFVAEKKALQQAA